MIEEIATMIVTIDGRQGQITNLFDVDGDETIVVEDAVSMVVKFAEDEWLAVGFESLRWIGDLS